MKAVIFDCDGVLVDSEEPGNRLLAEMARPYGYDAPLEDSLSLFKGVRLQTCLELIENSLGKALPGSFAETYRNALYQELENTVSPVEGVSEVLASLTLPTCVASGAPLKKIKMMLERCKLAGYFGDRIFSSYELDLWKPEPGLFLHAANALGFPSKEVAVVEDSAVGVRAGVAAGMRVFHYIPSAGISHDGPVTIFGRMNDLQKLFARPSSGS